MMGQALTIKDLSKTYPGAEHPVFKAYDLDLAPGSLCALVGVSGVGKTTLLNCIAGLDTWEAGQISVGQESVPKNDKEQLALFRRKHVGLAFQQPHLLPEFTVLENLLMPLYIDGSLNEQSEVWARQLLAWVNLSEMPERLPGTLSGGQAARVGLARALMRKPSLWLLDEPTGNLDPETGEEVFQVLLRLQAELRPTTLMVTHNPALADRCERIERLGV